MATSNAISTGSSQFSTDLQNVITRAVNIASLPLTQLNNGLTTLQTQSTDLKSVDSKFSALQSAVLGIQNAVAGASFQTTVSTPADLAATAGEGAAEGTYTVEVLDAGARTKSLTTNSWVNAPGAARTYQLWVGATSDPNNKIDITPTDNSAQSVASAINAQAGDKVRAIAVNVGSADAPSWRISLEGLTLDNAPLDIVDDGVSKQTQTLGRQAEYAVAGCTPVYSKTSTVQIAAGVTITLLAADEGNPVNITVSRPATALSSAVATFVSSYNAAVDAVAAQHGTKGGSLAGNSIVRDLDGVLSDIATYTSSLGNTGLRDLGITLDETNNGHLSFDSTTFQQNSSAAKAFLGTTEGTGFLKSVADMMNGLEDSTSGVFKSAEAGLQSQIERTSAQITTQQDQVTQLQERLNQRMAAVDAAIATMEQKYSFLSSMFSAMQANSKNN